MRITKLINLMTLTYTSGPKKGQPVALRDHVSGGRVDKVYAEVEGWDAQCAYVRYNGEVKTVTVRHSVIGAEWK